MNKMKPQKDQSILLVADLVGYGNLALTVMMPILTHLKYKVYNLPTSLISNNFCYGHFGVLDTTDYIQETIRIWESLDFSVDAVCTGYLVSEKQAQLVAQYCQKLKAKGTQIYVDPVMADNGKLYNGATQHTVDYMRKVCAVADVICPNFTEAKFLANKYIGKSSLNVGEAEDLLCVLHGLGAESVVITSMMMDNQPCTMIYNGKTHRSKVLKYDVIPAQFSGTGDLFSSIFIGKHQQGETLEKSVQVAMDFVYQMIRLNQTMENKDNGIPIEQYLDLIP